MKNALDDLSVVHRLCFATRTIPADSPNYWEIIAQFSIAQKHGYSLTGNQVKVFVENLQCLDPGVFDCDATLMKELVKIPKTHTNDSEKIG